MKDLTKLSLSTIESLSQFEKIDVLANGIHTFDRSIPKVLLKGERYLSVHTDGSFIGMIPESEFSAYRNRFIKTKKYINYKTTVRVKDKVSTKSGESIVIFSIKEQELEARKEELDKLMNSEFVLGKVEVISDFQAILSFGNVRNLVLTRPSFSKNGVVAFKDIFSVGDSVPISFDRFKKNGKEMRVKAYLPLPDIDFMKPYDANNFKEGDNIIGQVINVRAESILVAIAKDDSGNRKYKSAYSRHHPSPGIDDFLIVGMPVDITIRNISYDNLKDDFSYFVSINGVLPEMKEWIRTEYLKGVANLINNN